MFDFQSELGFLTYPFTILSVIALTLIIERVVLLSIYQKKQIQTKPAETFLDKYQQEDKNTREELALLWLEEQQHRLCKGMRVIQIIAIIAPLLGLMGTVFGLIQVFQDISHHVGPIEPNLLASGLGLAMKTTAAGLVISIPCLTCFYLLHLWVDTLLQKTETTLNTINLSFSGIRLNH